MSSFLQNFRIHFIAYPIIIAFIAFLFMGMSICQYDINMITNQKDAKVTLFIHTVEVPYDIPIPNFNYYEVPSPDGMYQFEEIVDKNDLHVGFIPNILLGK